MSKRTAPSKSSRKIRVAGLQHSGVATLHNRTTTTTTTTTKTTVNSGGRWCMH
ncbi:MAG: hypothetical protein ACYCUX_09075 [Metallibacterium sp.]